MPGKYEKKAKTPFGHLAPNWLAELLKTQETNKIAKVTEP
jgi:hypothetical protein